MQATTVTVNDGAVTCSVGSNVADAATMTHSKKSKKERRKERKKEELEEEEDGGWVVAEEKPDGPVRLSTRSQTLAFLNDMISDSGTTRTERVTFNGSYFEMTDGDCYECMGSTNDASHRRV